MREQTKNSTAARQRTVKFLPATSRLRRPRGGLKERCTGSRLSAADRCGFLDTENYAGKTYRRSTDGARIFTGGLRTLPRRSSVDSSRGWTRHRRVRPSRHRSPRLCALARARLSKRFTGKRLVQCRERITVSGQEHS